MHPASTRLAPVQRVTTSFIRGRSYNEKYIALEGNFHKTVVSRYIESTTGPTFGLTAGAGRSHGATLAQANVRPYASAQRAASSHAYS